MQKDIDLNNMSLFTKIWFLLTKKPLLVFTLFLTFFLLNSLILLNNDKIYIDEASDLLNIDFYASLLILVLCLYPLLMFSSLISFVQTLVESESLSSFQEKVNNLNLKTFLVSNMTRAIGHLLSLLLFFSFLATFYYLRELSSYFMIPTISLSFLLALFFLYGYIRILEQVISSNGFWQAFSAIWSIFKPSIFSSLWTTKYLITLASSIWFMIVAIQIPRLFYLSTDISSSNIISRAVELSFYTMVYILFFSFAIALLKSKKSDIKQLIIGMVLFLFLFIGLSSYKLWHNHEVKTLLELGDTYSDTKEYDNAIKTYHEVLEIEPLNDEAYCSLGYTYTHVKEYMKATESYYQYLEINPSSDNCYAYENLLELQLIQNLDFNKTIEEKCIELNEDDNEYFIGYEMLKIMDKIVKEEPVDLEAWSKKYEGIKSEWDFEELRMWISSMEEGEKKEKLLKALNTFEEHDTL